MAAARALQLDVGTAYGPCMLEPWAVTDGAPTRRVIDFANPGQAQGINPLGQRGVWLDGHYHDQTDRFVAGY